MLAFILGVVIIVVGLAVSIGLHEIGHLVPAKLFGVKVDAVHDRLRADALVEAQAARPSTA